MEQNWSQIQIQHGQVGTDSQGEGGGQWMENDCEVTPWVREGMGSC